MLASQPIESCALLTRVQAAGQSSGTASRPAIEVSGRPRRTRTMTCGLLSPNVRVGLSKRFAIRHNTIGRASRSFTAFGWFCSLTALLIFADRDRVSSCHRRTHETLGLAWCTYFDRSPRFLQRFVQSQLSQVTTTSARLHTAGTSSSSNAKRHRRARKNALPAPLDHRMGAGPDIDAAEAHRVPGRHRRRHERASCGCGRDRCVRQATDRPTRRRDPLL